MPSPTPTHRLDVAGLHEAVRTRPDRERHGRVSGEEPLPRDGDSNGCCSSEPCSHFDAGKQFKSSVSGSLRQFSLRRAASFGALGDEELFIIEGSCQLDRDALSR